MIQSDVHVALSSTAAGALGFVIHLNTSLPPLRAVLLIVYLDCSIYVGNTVLSLFAFTWTPEVLAYSNHIYTFLMGYSPYGTYS